MKNIRLHNHTIFSDGKNTPEEMIEKAIELGIEEFGISDHSYTFFDEEYCIPKNKINAYKETINNLKEEYKDRIILKLGIEQDYYSEEPVDDYNYVIGSVHYVKVDKHNKYNKTGKEIYIPVDESINKAADIIKKAADDYFEGDIYSLIEEYYLSVGNVVKKTGAGIIGHFDVITKCNDSHHIFDEDDPRYIKAWQSAADMLLKENVIFEINTSPLRRKEKKEPYPSFAIQRYLKENGAKFIISGDCHSVSEMEFDIAVNASFSPFV